jgi:hypothetical protein
LAKIIAVDLAGEGLTAAITYVGGFEKSTTIRADQFELWLAPPVTATADVQPQVLVLYLDEARQAEAAKIGEAVSTISAEYPVRRDTLQGRDLELPPADRASLFPHGGSGRGRQADRPAPGCGRPLREAALHAVEQEIPRRFFEI